MGVWPQVKSLIEDVQDAGNTWFTPLKDRKRPLVLSFVPKRRNCQVNGLAVCPLQTSEPCRPLVVDFRDERNSFLFGKTVVIAALMLIEASRRAPLDAPL